MKKVFLIFLLFILLMQSNTQSCPVLCSICATSTSSCSNCYPDFQNVFYTTMAISGSCPCPDGYYMNSTNRLCFFCPITCQTCTSQSVCLTCIIGYQIDNNKQCTRKYSNDGQWLTMDIASDLSQQKLQKLQIQGFYLQNFISSMNMANSVRNCSGLGSTLFFGLYAFDYNTQIIKSYYGLPYHNWAHIRFQYIAADTWRQTQMILQINDQQSYSINTLESVGYSYEKTYSSLDRHRNFCLNSQPDNLGFIDAYISHSASMLKLRIKTSLFYLNDTNTVDYAKGVYFGIRNVFVRVGTCPTNCKRCLGPTRCFQCIPPYKSPIPNNGTCICDLTISQVTQLGKCVPLCSKGYLFTKISTMNQSKCMLCENINQYLQNCYICDFSGNDSSPIICKVCQEGYYLNSSGICSSECSITTSGNATYSATYSMNLAYCQNCPSNCSYCYFSSCTNCTNTVFYQGVCVNNCPNNFYLDSRTKQCYPCSKNCAKCTSQSNCIQCLDTQNFILTTTGFCMLKCLIYQNCSSYVCHSSCNTCFGNLSSQCITCKNVAYYLQNYNCVLQCSVGYYSLSNGYCQACLYPCSSCINKFSCNSCISGYFLYQQTCVRLCPLNYYADLNNICKVCSDKCIRCVSLTICLDCINGYQLYGGQCLTKVVCSQGTYYDQNINKCMDCPLNCTSCYKDLCYRCTLDSVLDNGKCLSSCSDEKYQKTETYTDPLTSVQTNYRICLWKDPLCNQYSTNSLTQTCNQCIFMNPLLVLITDPTNSSNYKCTFSCPISTVKVVNNNMVSCQNCPTYCEQCLTNLTCIKCNSNYVLNPIINATPACLSSCPPGYISDGYLCIHCPSNCKVCSITGICTQCFSSYVFKGNNCLPDTTCLSYQFNTVPTGSCTNCSSNCLTCSGVFTSCTSCGTNNGTQLYMKLGTCVQDCNIGGLGYFKSNQNYQCRKCSAICATCISLTQCTSCISGYYLLAYPIQTISGVSIGTCVLQCPIGYYNYNPYNTINQIAYCAFCSPNCLTCFGPSQDQCLTCYGTFKMNHNSRCVQFCPPNKYEDATHHCDWCHPSCMSCYGPAQFQCISCQSGYFLYRSTCYPYSCPGSTYMVDYDNRICEPCQWGCQVCYNPYNCTVCTGGFYLYEGWCYLSCPQNTQPYLDLINQGYRCGNCSKKWTNCLQCTTDYCQRCNQLYYLIKNTTVSSIPCVNSCPLGYFASISLSRQCILCSKNCISCTSLTNCLSCTVGFALVNGICTINCQTFQYFVPSLSVCKNCSQFCLNCLSDFQCINCLSGYYLNTQTNNNSIYSYCILSCPKGYYPDQSLKACRKCSQNCIQCSNYTNCITCINSSFQIIYGFCYQNNSSNCNIPNCSYCLSSTACQLCQIPYYLYNTLNSIGQTISKCVIDCPQGFYVNGRACQNCNSSCTSCFNSQNNCSSCISGLYLFERRCWSSCPIGYFKNQTLRTCQKCAQSCYNCLNQSYCLYCQSNYELYRGICYLQCPQKTYASGLICLDCLTSCQLCKSSYYCDRCQYPYVKYQQKCVAQCPTTYYLQLTDLNCIKCSYPCLTCRSSTECISCESGFILSASASVCLNHCENGFYPKITTNNGYQCAPCSTGCSSCFNSTYCQKCISNYYTWSGRCLITCPDGTYNQQTTKTCKPCSRYCLSCTSNTCVQCHNQTILYNGQCINFCPSGTYVSNEYSYVLSVSVTTCKVCISPCLQCTAGTTNNCSSCISGFYLYQNYCVTTCPAKYYSDMTQNRCIKCPNGCSACTSAGCTQCESNWTLSNNVCTPNSNCTLPYCQTCQIISLNSSTLYMCWKCLTPYYLVFNSFLAAGSITVSGSIYTCLMNCPTGTYAGTNYICQPCPINCTVCSSALLCSNCKPQFYLYKNSCVQICPNGYTPSNMNICIQNLCLYNNSQNLCQQCLPPYLLQQGRCVNSCSNGFYQQDSFCKKCDSTIYNCLTCSSLSVCKSCLPGYILYQNQCLSSCPSGFYYSSIQNICKICSNPMTGCLTCTSATSCTKCQQPYYLNSDNRCVLNCPDGYFKSQTQQKCIKCQQNCISCINKTTCTACNNATTLYNADCLVVCPSPGFYKQLSTNLCEKCNYKCYSCLSFDNCTSCQPNFVLLQSNSVTNPIYSCVQVCPAGYYKSINSICVLCSSQCLTCDFQKCLSCSSTKYLFNGKCLSACPDHFYSTLSGKCQICDSQCKTCALSSQLCTSCYSGYNYVNASKSCVRICEANHYYDSITYSCKNCSLDCQNCYGPRYDQCISCREPLALYNNICVVKCPQMMFKDTDTVCKQCDQSKCLTCVTSSTNCTSCNYPRVLIVESNNGICKDNCGQGYYYDILNAKCVACQQKCNSCLDLFDCIICNDETYLYDGKCLPSCPSGFVAINGTSQNVCKKCPSNCLNCNYIAATGILQCSQCLTGFYLFNQICYSQCPASTYLNSGNCVTCLQKCLTCKDGVSCLTCKYPYLFYNGDCVSVCPTNFEALNYVCYPKKICSQFIYNNTCYSVCPVGTYNPINSNNCLDCPVLCSQCSSPSKCTKCKSGFYLYNDIANSLTTCVQNCPSGTYLNNNYCISCPSQCKSCSVLLGYTNIKCLQCNSGFLFDGSCLTSCPSGYYGENSICKRCNINCLSCTNLTACTACANSYYQLPTCETGNITCLSNQYTSPLTGGCQNCNSACLTCFGPSAGQCKSCNNVSSNVYYLYQTSCLLTCPDQYYKDTINNKCVMCSVLNCKNCSISLNSCSSCIYGYILALDINSTPKCVQNCVQMNSASQTYIFNPVSNTCTSCSVLINNCLECYYSATSNQNNICSKCKTNYYLLPNNTCSTCTQPGYYISQTKYCTNCDQFCSICLNQATCQTCINSYALYLGKCYTACPQGFYNNSGICTACSDKCKVCSSSGCSQCISPYALSNLYQCTICISGYFYKSLTSSCEKCNYNCLQCTNTQTYCTKCSNPLLLLNNKCYYQCPSGYYVDNSTSTPICSLCSSLVSDCSVCSITQGCRKCKDNFYLYASSASSNYSCVGICPAGYYPDTVTMSCIKCNITNCLECSSNMQCTKCTSTTYFINGACLNTCPYGYAPSSTRVANNLVCQKCKSGCKECSPNINTCLICEQNLQGDGTGACVLKPNSCTSNQYLNSLNNCSNCHQSCLTCYGGERTNCLSCRTPEYQLQSDKSCKKICVDSQYYNVGANSCVNCSTKYGQYCISCDSNKCFTCSVGILSSDYQSCATNCLQGTYQYNGVCINCPQYCKVCNSSTYCSECITNSPAYLLYNNLCYQNCPPGTQPYLGTCRDCNSGCMTCSNTISNCTSCFGPYKLQGSSCVSQCSAGYYEGTPSAVGIICLPCLSPCANCSITSSNCTSCISTYFFYQNSCLNNCPPKMYADSLTQSCKNCAFPCSQCIQSSTKCTSCQSGYIFDSTTNTCTNQCSYGFYFYMDPSTSISSCIACSISNCKECDNSVCYNCNDNTYAILNLANTIVSCSTSCPNGYFAQNSSRTCQKCFDGCVTCISKIDCSKCDSAYYLFNNQCLSNCPINTYSSGNITNGYICLNCGLLCSVCTNNLTCTTCMDGSYLLNGICYNKCPNGYFERLSDKTCRPCAITNCKICSSTDCQSCIDNYFGFLNNATNKIIQCRNNCGQNYFANSITRMCQSCLNGCKTCLNNYSCIQCQLSKSLLIQGNQYYCLDQCPLTFFKDTRSTPVTCRSCQINCKQCNNEDNCYNCIENYSLFYDTLNQDRCISDCPLMYYQATNNQGFSQCKSCSPHCLKCVSSTQCNLCQSTHTLVNSVCIPNNCVNCDTCDQTVSPAICKKCSNSYYLYKNKCIAECPIYYFKTTNTSSNVAYCQKCIDNCVYCNDKLTCNECIPFYTFVREKGCVDAAVQQYGQVANMSGFTSNITQTLATVYLGTSVGPVAFGEMSSTYFNIQFTQLMLFHPPGGNPQMTNFLNSLQTMSLTNGAASTANTSAPLQVSRRLLISSNPSEAFIQVNAPIFYLMFAFIAAYASIYIFQRFITQACRVSCNTAWFYLDTICDFMKKRFKWIYFDFIMWISYIPFLYFSVMQLKSFKFDNGSQIVSSLLSIAIIVVYPLYPVFICYLLHSNYSQISLQPGEQPKSTLTQMSLSPYLTKVKRPVKNYVLPFEEQPLSFQKYFKVINFILIYYPLKYVRKLLFIFCAALIQTPTNMVSTLIAINVAFIIYMIALKPRTMPYLLFDLIIQFVLLTFQVFLLVYLMMDGPKVAMMSIVTHVVGFITANLSIIVAIVLNLIAYYKIFLCIKDLIAHLRQKAGQRQQAQNKFQIQKKFLDPTSQFYIDKQIGKLKRLGDNDDTDEDDDSFRLSNAGRKLAQNLGQKQLLLNGIDPVKYVKQLTKAQNFRFEEKDRALKYVNQDDATDSDDSQIDQNALNMIKKLQMDEKTLALNKIHPVKYAKQITKDNGPLQNIYKKFDQKHVDKLIAKRINDDGQTDSDDESLDQNTMNLVKNLNLNEKQLAFNQINPIKFLKQETKKDAPLQDRYKKFDQKNVDKKLAKIINQDNATDSDDSQIDQDMHDLAKKLQLNEKQLAFNQINPVKFFKDQTKKDAPLEQQYHKFDEKHMDKVLAHRINQDHETDSDEDSSVDQNAHELARKLNLNQKQLAANQINPLKFFKEQTKLQAPLQQVYKKFDQKNVDKQLKKVINDDGDTDSQNQSEQDEAKQEAYRLARDLKLNEKQLAANNLKPIKVMQDEAKKDQKLKNIMKKFDQKDMDLKVARMINDNGQTSSEQQSDQQQLDKVIVARQLKLDQKQLAANNINPIKFVKQTTKIDPITNQPKINHAVLSTSQKNKITEKARKKLLDKQLEMRNQMKRQMSQNSGTDQDQQDIRLSKFTKEKLKNMTEKQMIMQGLDPIKAVKKITKQAIAKKMAKMNNPKNNRVYDDQMPDFKVSSNNNAGTIKNALRNTQQKLKQTTKNMLGSGKNMLGSGKKNNIKNSQRIPSQQSSEHKNNSNLIDSQSDHQYTKLNSKNVKNVNMNKSVTPPAYQTRQFILNNKNANRLQNQWNDEFEGIQDKNKPKIIIKEQQKIKKNKQQNKNPKISLVDPNNKIKNFDQQFNESYTSEMSSEMALKGLLKPNNNSQDLEDIQLQHVKSNKNIKANNLLINLDQNNNNLKSNPKLSKNQQNKKSNSQLNLRGGNSKNLRQDQMFNDFEEFEDLGQIAPKRLTDKKYTKKNRPHNSDIQDSDQLQEQQIQDINKKQIKDPKYKRKGNQSSRLPGDVVQSVTFKNQKIQSKNSIPSNRSMGTEKYQDVVKNNKMALKLPTSFQAANQIFQSVQFGSRPQSKVVRPSKGNNKSNVHSDSEEQQNYASNIRKDRISNRQRLRSIHSQNPSQNGVDSKRSSQLIKGDRQSRKKIEKLKIQNMSQNQDQIQSIEA